jgi:hypothetical protein
MTPSEILSQAVPATQVAELKAALKQLEEAMSVPIDLTLFFINRSFTLPR